MFISASYIFLRCLSNRLSVKMNQAIKDVLFFWFFFYPARSEIKQNKREPAFEKINNLLCKKAVFCHGNWSSVEVRFPCRQSGDKSWFRRHFIRLLSKRKVYWFESAEETCLQGSGGWLLISTPRAFVPSSPSFLFLLLFSFSLFLNQAAFCSPAGVRSLVSPLLPTPTFHLVIKGVFWG